ncbi:MAG: hypothetical protein R6V58_03525 [Planctomycetota bacterium]
MTKRLSFALVLLLLTTAARGGDRPPDLEAGLRAARADAFRNLSRRIYALPARRGTVEQVILQDERLRRQVEMALMTAPVDGEPQVDEHGIVTVVLDLSTNALPYQVRSGIKDLPRYMRADGVASRTAAFQVERTVVSGVNESVAGWAKKTVEAEALQTSRGAPTAASKEAARRQAAHNALGALVKKVNDLPLDPQATVGGFLARHPRLRPEVNALLVGAFGDAELVSERIDRLGTTYTAKMKIALPGGMLLRPLRLGPWREGRGEVLTEAALDLARTHAFRNARQQLRRKIYSLKLGTGRRARELIERRKDIKAAVDRLVGQVPLQQVEITPGGMAKIRMSILTAQLPDAINRAMRYGADPRITALGGGLPVQAEKPAEKEKEGEGGND